MQRLASAVQHTSCQADGKRMSKGCVAADRVRVEAAADTALSARRRSERPGAVVIAYLRARACHVDDLSMTAAGASIAKTSGERTK
jgi:hypothetical protein